MPSVSTAIRKVPTLEPRSVLVRYGSAVLLVLVALLVTLAVRPYVDRIIFVFFWPAIVGAAMFGGVGPGLFASFLAVALADYFVIGPVRSFQPTDPVEIIQLLVFLSIAGAVSSAAGRVRTARQQATEAAEQNASLATGLEQQAMELERQLEESQSLQEELEQSSEDNARLHRAESDARRAAEAANLAKTQFLAVMSHELRTPLNAIAGYAELMRMGIRGPVTAEQQADLDRIRRSQRNLLSLINDVLNYAKLEAGHIDFDTRDILIHEFLGDIEALVTPQLQDKGLSYAYDECDGKLAVKADVEKMRQILLNLLSNAIKFTPAGGKVFIECDVDDERVRIRVCDTGAGIPADKIVAIFEPFIQLDRKLTSVHEGTGLGLAISRDLARAMGGDLSAESTLGGGSAFTLELPRGDGDAAIAPGGKQD